MVSLVHSLFKCVIPIDEFVCLSVSNKFRLMKHSLDFFSGGIIPIPWDVFLHHFASPDSNVWETPISPDFCIK